MDELGLQNVISSNNLSYEEVLILISPFLGTIYIYTLELFPSQSD
jgi:hypothetical protein